MTGQDAASFVVLHHIRDFAGWEAALAEGHSWPDGFDLRSFVETDDQELAVCVWRAPSRDQLQQSLDAAFGDVVVNEIHAATIQVMREHESADPDS